jgi:hypothetical protein
MRHAGGGESARGPQLVVRAQERRGAVEDADAAPPQGEQLEQPRRDAVERGPDVDPADGRVARTEHEQRGARVEPARLDPVRAPRLDERVVRRARPATADDGRHCHDPAIRDAGGEAIRRGYGSSLAPRSGSAAARFVTR